MDGRPRARPSVIDAGRHPILGVRINAVDYEAAVEAIISAAQRGQPMAVSAIAVHGVMTGALDAEHRRRLNSLDMLLPDGQPVRWALGWKHGVRLADRVYGPKLMLALCGRAARDRLPIYLYGSSPDVLARLRERLVARFPELHIAGAAPSRFRTLTEMEQKEAADSINGSGARLVFVGLGCPRQETWAFENRPLLRMPCVAVGAAFPFHAEMAPMAPAWMQRSGLEWLFRLYHQPGRLWKRYLLLNPLYLIMTGAEVLRVLRLSEGATGQPRPVRAG